MDLHLSSVSLYFLSVIQCSYCILPKGIAPELASFYTPLHDEKFTCLDKSAVIPWTWINDDYCDCRDGSDEPGTAACPNMVFYCDENVHMNKPISSSFVNDMFCDCCDGSDEYLGYINCSNNCGELARARESQITRRRQELERGHDIYKEFISKKAQELAQQAEAERLLTEQKRQEEEQSSSGHSIDEQSVKVPTEHKYDSINEYSNLEQNGASEEEVEEEGEGEERNGDGEEKEEDGKGEEQEDEIHGDEKLHYNEKMLHHDDHESQREVDELDSTIPQTEPENKPVPETPPPPPPKPIDFGPDNGFLFLTEPEVGCLELEHNEYIYSLCPFKNAHQHSSSDRTSGTLLGSWNSWVSHPEESINWDREAKMKLPYNEMLYDNGNSCWNGPARSVIVKVACGSENKFLSADEPSRCTYLFHIQTPAACHRHPDDMMALMHTEL